MIMGGAEPLGGSDFMSFIIAPYFGGLLGFISGLFGNPIVNRRAILYFGFILSIIVLAMELPYILDSSSELNPYETVMFILSGPIVLGSVRVGILIRFFAGYIAGVYKKKDFKPLWKNVTRLY